MRHLYLEAKISKIFTRIQRAVSHNIFYNWMPIPVSSELLPISLPWCQQPFSASLALFLDGLEAGSAAWYHLRHLNKLFTLKIRGIYSGQPETPPPPSKILPFLWIFKLHKGILTCVLSLFSFFFFFPLFPSFFHEVLLQILSSFTIWTKMARIYIPVEDC